MDRKQVTQQVVVGLVFMGALGLVALGWLIWGPSRSPATFQIKSVPAPVAVASEKGEPEPEEVEEEEPDEGGPVPTIARPAAAARPTLAASQRPDLSPGAGVRSLAGGQTEDAPAVRKPSVAALAEFKPLDVVDRFNTRLPQFVMAMARDGAGNLWIGSEDQGIFRYCPSTRRMTQFTTKDGLGDDNGYAVAVDKLGRVWVGHLNHGVSVYVPRVESRKQKVEGKAGGGAEGAEGAWQNYEVVAGLTRPDTLAGPIGERVFSIAVNPVDGDVWISTNAGLARYFSGKAETQKVEIRNEEGVWRYYGRAEGMSSDQVQSLAFDAQGRLYAGTQCDGIDIADPADDYQSWRNVRGAQKLPTSPAGPGLPTDLINQLLVTRDGAVYAATTTGLAWSKDRGDSWRYLRGADWADKVRGLYGGPPNGWDEAAEVQKSAIKNVLAEDYINCLAEDEKGQLCLGYRQKGAAWVDPGTFAQSPLGGGSEYVNAVSVDPTGRLFVGTYGDGGVLASATGESSKGTAAGTASKSVAFPAGAKPPTEAELAGMLERVKGIAASKNTDAPMVAVLPDDWATQGDWVGRYGHDLALLCAADAPFDMSVEFGTGTYGVIGRIGKNAAQTDSIRRWLDALRDTHQRALWMPMLGYRRQGEWDDHGEAYPMAQDGPDLYAEVSVPAGLHEMSLYFVNPDGHGGSNRFRDFEISVGLPGGPAGEEMLCQARSRIRDFWGGVYKSFAITGPGKYTLHIARSHSFNTIVSGVMLAKQWGPKTDFDDIPRPWTGGVSFGAPSLMPIRYYRAGVRPMLNILTQCIETEVPRLIRHRTAVLRLVCRSTLAARAREDVVASVRWNARLWSDVDRTQYRTASEEAWARMVRVNPNLAGNGPGSSTLAGKGESR